MPKLLLLISLIGLMLACEEPYREKKSFLLSGDKLAEKKAEREDLRNKDSVPPLESDFDEEATRIPIDFDGTFGDGDLTDDGTQDWGDGINVPELPSRDPIEDGTHDLENIPDLPSRPSRDPIDFDGTFGDGINVPDRPSRDPIDFDGTFGDGDLTDDGTRDYGDGVNLPDRPSRDPIDLDGTFGDYDLTDDGTQDWGDWINIDEDGTMGDYDLTDDGTQDWGDWINIDNDGTMGDGDLTDDGTLDWENPGVNLPAPPYYGWAPEGAGDILPSWKIGDFKTLVAEKDANGDYHFDLGDNVLDEFVNGTLDTSKIIYSNTTFFNNLELAQNDNETGEIWYSKDDSNNRPDLKWYVEPGWTNNRYTEVKYQDSYYVLDFPKAIMDANPSKPTGTKRVSFMISISAEGQQAAIRNPIQYHWKGFVDDFGKIDIQLVGIRLIYDEKDQNDDEVYGNVKMRDPYYPL